MQRTFYRRFTTARPPLPVILSASRTPIGSFQGALSSFTAPQLGGFTIAETISKAGLNASQIDEVYFGNVISAGIGQAPARQASLKGGVPKHVPCTTINKVCASGMKAVMYAAQSISSGYNRCVLAGGMESMSNIPFYLPKARTGYGYGHGQVIDGLVFDGLTDAYDGSAMGLCAEDCAQRHGITREQQDTFALNSYKRASDAQKKLSFKEEIVAITVKGKKGNVVVEDDEEVAKLQASKVSSLRPVFKPDGTITAANASKLNDGASSLLVASAAFATEHNYTPVARILGMADFEREPREFTDAPADAVARAIKNAGLTPQQIDVYEINEAFSVVALANLKLLNIDPAICNINGGGVALGHPLGSSGSRILVTLIHVLKQQNKTIGVAAICNGGGGASAVVIERL